MLSVLSVVAKRDIQIMLTNPSTDFVHTSVALYTE